MINPNFGNLGYWLNGLPSPLVVDVSKTSLGGQTWWKDGMPSPIQALTPFPIYKKLYRHSRISDRPPDSILIW